MWVAAFQKLFLCYVRVIAKLLFFFFFLIVYDFVCMYIPVLHLLIGANRYKL